MPTFNLSCKSCGTFEKRRRSWRWDKATPEQLTEVKACKCGGEMERKPNPPQAHKKEVLDNGIMAKAIERFADAQEMYTERADNDPKNSR